MKIRHRLIAGIEGYSFERPDLDPRVTGYARATIDALAALETQNRMPSIPNKKRIAEIVVLLKQMRDTGELVQAALKEEIRKVDPMAEPAIIDQLVAQLSHLPNLLRQTFDILEPGQEFPELLREYLNRIQYPGPEDIEHGVVPIPDQTTLKMVYTPVVAALGDLVEAMHMELATLNVLCAVRLPGRVRKIIHLRQDRLSELLRSLTLVSGSIRIPRLSTGTEKGIYWKNPVTGETQVNPILLQVEAYIRRFKGPVCLVITNHTAVLGIGNKGSQGGQNTMHGKKRINEAKGHFNTIAVEIDTTNENEFIEIAEYLGRIPNVRAFNLEDITGSGNVCFNIQRRLQEKLTIPIFHDDQDGTAIISTAAVLVGLVDMGIIGSIDDPLDEVSALVFGMGAAGIKCSRYLMELGLRKLVGFDSLGILSRTRPDLVSNREVNPLYASNAEKIALLADTSDHGRQSDLAILAASEGISLADRGAWNRWVKAEDIVNRSARKREALIRQTLANEILTQERLAAFKDKHLFLGMSDANIVTPSMIHRMAPRAVVFACANPHPEIDYHLLRSLRPETRLVAGTGNSRYPNQVNNAVAFPGLLAGLMLSGATKLDIPTGLAAAKAIAKRTLELRQQNPDFTSVVPAVFDDRVHYLVAVATANAVYQAGINRTADGMQPTRTDVFPEIDQRFGVSGG